MICHKDKRHLFDLETGIRVEKQKDDSFNSFVFYDYQHNQFFTIQTSDNDKEYFLSDFTVESLKQTKALASASKTFASPIDTIREQYLKDHVSAPVTNVIKRKMIKKV